MSKLRFQKDVQIRKTVVANVVNQERRSKCVAHGPHLAIRSPTHGVDFNSV